MGLNCNADNVTYPNVAVCKIFQFLLNCENSKLHIYWILHSIFHNRIHLPC